jgi:hypothetical protein
LLDDEWREELFRVTGGTVNRLGCQSLIVGGVADHVHLLFQLSRTITIGDTVGKIKLKLPSVVLRHSKGANELAEHGVLAIDGITLFTEQPRFPLAQYGLMERTQVLGELLDRRRCGQARGHSLL